MHKINGNTCLTSWFKHSLSCFIRELVTLKNNKNLGGTRLGFHHFLVFGTPDETLKLGVELPHQKPSHDTL